jgi:hypothetical protein
MLCFCTKHELSQRGNTCKLRFSMTCDLACFRICFRIVSASFRACWFFTHIVKSDGKSYINGRWRRRQGGFGAPPHVGATCCEVNLGTGGHNGDFTASETGFRTPQKSGHEKVLRNESRIELRGRKYHQNAQQNEPDATGGIPGPELGPKNFKFLVRNLPVKSPPPSTTTARCKVNGNAPSFQRQRGLPQPPPAVGPRHGHPRHTPRE